MVRTGTAGACVCAAGVPRQQGSALERQTEGPTDRHRGRDGQPHPRPHARGFCLAAPISLPCHPGKLFLFRLQKCHYLVSQEAAPPPLLEPDPASPGPAPGHRWAPRRMARDTPSASSQRGAPGAGPAHAQGSAHCSRGASGDRRRAGQGLGDTQAQPRPCGCPDRTFPTDAPSSLGDRIASYALTTPPRAETNKLRGAVVSSSNPTPAPSCSRPVGSRDRQEPTCAPLSPPLPDSAPRSSQGDFQKRHPTASCSCPLPGDLPAWAKTQP